MTHKVKVTFTIELTAEQRKACLIYAEEAGHNYGHPSPQKLLKRLFREQGESAITSAIEAKNDKARKPQEF